MSLLQRGRLASEIIAVDVNRPTEITEILSGLIPKRLLSTTSINMRLNIDPPLLNSSNPWATTLEDLKTLYECPYTGAITTRTSLLGGFPHDDNIHQYTFFNPNTHKICVDKASPCDSGSGSLNTLGYSPIPLKEYLGYIEILSKGLKEDKLRKPVLISVTGTVEDIVECLHEISLTQKRVSMPLAMEINLSCPNIPDKPPPAYSDSCLTEYLSALKTAQLKEESSGGKILDIPVGIKVPPYTYSDQFSVLTKALLASATPHTATTAACPISFITATNTLGTSFLLRSSTSLDPVLSSPNGSGIGGLAGAPLHPLALGNVYTLKKNILSHPQLSHIQIIGVGGVEDHDGYLRMLQVGASAVGVGTALGRKGIDIFREIYQGIEV